MGLFSIFAKKSKPNLTPPIGMPTTDDLPFLGPDSRARGDNLRAYASSRIRGENLGFGDDFVSKATNPVIKGRETLFRESTVPTISNQYSSRGLGKSSLAANAVGKAERDKNQDIDELVSKFYVLNESQKKTDQANAVGLAERINDQAAGIETNRANASANLQNATVKQTNLNNAQNREDADAIGSFVTSILTGGGAGAMGGGGWSGAMSGALGGAQQSLQGSPKANISSSQARMMSSEEFEALLDQYFGGA